MQNSSFLAALLLLAVSSCHASDASDAALKGNCDAPVSKDLR